MIKISSILKTEAVKPYKGVSKNRGGPPKSSILTGFSPVTHPFWGTTIFGNTHKPIIQRYSNATFSHARAVPRGRSGRSCAAVAPES